MRISKRNLYTIWLFILMLFTTWQDFYLWYSIGKIASSAIFILVPFFIFFEFFVLSKKKKHLEFGGGFSKIFIIVLVLFLIISIPYLIFFSFQLKISFLGENIYIKTIKQLLYYLMIILFIRNLDYTLKKVNSFQVISKVSYLVICTMLIILIGELLELNKNWIYPNKPMAWDFLHSNLTYFYWRVRLLTSESSFTGPIAVFFSILALINIGDNRKKRVVRWAVVLVFFFLYFITSRSKGFFLCLVLAVLFQALYKVNKKVLLISFLVVISTVVVFFTKIDKTYLLNAAGSVMTRYTGLIAGIYSMLFNPLGVGALNYIYSLDYIIEVSSFTKSILGEYGDITEIEKWASKGSDKGLGIKSTLGRWCLTFGIFGAVIYFYLCSKLIKYNKNNKLMLLGAFFFVFYTTFVRPIEMEYPCITFLVVSQFIYRSKIKQDG